MVYPRRLPHAPHDPHVPHVRYVPLMSRNAPVLMEVPAVINDHQPIVVQREFVYPRRA